MICFIAIIFDEMFYNVWLYPTLHTLLNQRSTSATNVAETVMLEWGW